MWFVDCSLSNSRSIASFTPAPHHTKSRIHIQYKCVFLLDCCSPPFEKKRWPASLERRTCHTNRTSYCVCGFSNKEKGVPVFLSVHSRIRSNIARILFQYSFCVGIPIYNIRCWCMIVPASFSRKRNYGANTIMYQYRFWSVFPLFSKAFLSSIPGSNPILHQHCFWYFFRY